MASWFLSILNDFSQSTNKTILNSINLSRMCYNPIIGHYFLKFNKKLFGVWKFPKEYFKERKFLQELFRNLYIINFCYTLRTNSVFFFKKNYSLYDYRVGYQDIYCIMYICNYSATEKHSAFLTIITSKKTLLALLDNIINIPFNFHMLKIKGLLNEDK